MKWNELGVEQKVSATVRWLGGDGGEQNVARDMVTTGSVTLKESEVREWFDSYQDDLEIQKAFIS